jgi:hypothetical protein
MTNPQLRDRQLKHLGGHRPQNASVDDLSIPYRQRSGTRRRIVGVTFVRAPMRRRVWRRRLLVYLIQAFMLSLLILPFVVNLWPFVVTREQDKLPSIDITGRPQTVFNWNDSACDDVDVPDTPARAFRDFRGRVVLIASSYTTRPMVGSSLNTVRHSCAVAMHSRFDPDPARFSDREWIGGTYTPDGKTVFALVHNEYEGDTHPGRCPSGTHLLCWYNAITLSVSSDGGRHFSHAHSPTHLVASVPYRYVPDTGPYGVFHPSNIVRNPDDGYYYSVVQVQKYRKQAGGTCVMRTRSLADPRSWRAWDGDGFNVTFINPYLESDQSPGDHVCRPVEPRRITGFSQSLTYNTYLGKWVLMGATSAYTFQRGANVPGLFFSVSDDLIHWSQLRLVKAAELPWTYDCGGQSPVLYPSLIDPHSPGRNFDTTGKRAYLYYTSFNYLDCHMTPDRDLVRVPVVFRK